MKDIQEAFEEFHRVNPHIYTMILEITRVLKARGKRFGMETVWGRIRWMTEIEATSPPGDLYKLNDHYTSRYARMVNEEPDLLGIFETRRLRAA